MRTVEINFKKLRKSRKKRKLSIKQLAEMVEIPYTTLQKYESGAIKKIPLEVLKKICEIYGTDYGMYFWWIKFNSLSDIILHFIYYPEKFERDRKLFEILSITEYFDFDNKDNIYMSLYNKLNEREKDDYNKFKILVLITLKVDENFTINEFLEEEKVLFSFFYANKIKKEKQIDLSILKKEK